MRRFCVLVNIFLSLAALNVPLYVLLTSRASQAEIKGKSTVTCGRSNLEKVFVSAHWSMFY